MRNLLAFTLLFFIIQCEPIPQNQSIQEDEKGISEWVDLLKSSSSDSAQLNQLWDDLVSIHKIPYTKDDSILFLYRGSANEVQWQGDFTGWGRNSNARGTQIAGTSIFYCKYSLPNDARVDYKVVVDGSWILDPYNSKTQYSGFGPNSELRMPDYTPSGYTELLEGVLAGSNTSRQLIESDALGYTVDYRVWKPASYDSSRSTPYPVLYTTDGHEYRSANLGAARNVAANLIHESLIEPIVIVFVSPINPYNSNQNRRQDEYVLNSSYSRFLVDELIPEIEANYHVSDKPEHRAILGTSLGGLHSAYIMATELESFKLIGIHSPAFWYREQIYDLVENQQLKPDKIFMSTGTINDTEEGADRMASIFTEKNWQFEYVKVNEGHSWGNWSNLMDQTLIHLFNPPNTTSIEKN